MTKRKMILCAAVLAVAGVAIVLRSKPSAGKASGVSTAEAAVESNAQPTVAATAGVAPAFAALSTNQTLTVRGTKPYVLTSVEPFQKSLRLAAEAMGARTVCSLSRNELLIEATPEACARLAADSRFEDVAEFVSSSKVQPELAAMIAGGAKSVDVSLVALAAEDRELVVSCLKAGGGEMLQGCFNAGDTIRAKLPSDLVASLATRGDVRWMEKFEYPKLMNDLAIKPDAMSVTNVWDTSRDLGLTGKGQKISTSDSGIDTGSTNTMHRDLFRRVKDMKLVRDDAGEVIVTTTDLSGHGTHTAGSIVGDGTMSTNQIRGTAYAADLYAWFCGASNLKSVYTPSTPDLLFTADGAWTNFIHSASWGSAVNGEYDARCANIDTYVWKNAEYLPVFSAGNEGCDDYGKVIYTQSIGSPAASKNVLAVGATQSSRTEGDGGWGNGDVTKTAIFSSRGPCKDGRTKPDIAAPGVGILSTRSHGVNYSYGNYNDYYAYDSGTSMSCPLTAGAVALVRQWLIEKRGFVDEAGKRPTSALMKAVIMGGAKGAETPNNDQGWGRVDLADTLAPTNGCAVMLVDRIPFEEGFYTNIVIETTNAAPLDVQLVWVDYPGSASGSQSAPKLINDLDLTVSARIPGEPTVRYGNGGDDVDTLNNAESVRIERATPNTYVITVDCRTILHDYTEGGAAALYIRGAFDPTAKVDEPAYVHLKKLKKDFMSLDRALKSVRHDDETVEILDWVNFDRSVTLTNSCTIVATNEDAAASYVLRSRDALLTVATNATVTLSNVVFATSTKPLVAVENGGCLQMGSKADLGVDVYHLSVSFANTNGFDLAGELTKSILVHCDAATEIGQAFGTYSCSKEMADTCAARIVCVDDIDRETRGGVGPDGTLVWTHVNVPVDEAFGYFVDDKGLTNTFARAEKALPYFKDAYEKGKASAFVVRRAGNFGSYFNVDKPMVLRGEGDTRPVLSASGSSGFLLETGGSLVISNLVFTGYVDDTTDDYYGFIAIDGGELTLDDGATLDGMTGYVYEGSGIIDLWSGMVTMKPGSAIVNCRAEGGTWYDEDEMPHDSGGFGGAIYTANQEGGMLNLEGGVISNCYGSAFGGGVYVADHYGESAVVKVSGDLTVRENFSAAAPEDDICLDNTRVLPNFRLAGPLSGTNVVGVWISTPLIGEEGINAEGKPFGTNAVGAVVATTAFFNDTDETLTGALGEGGMLVWTKKPVDDGQCDPKVAVAIVTEYDGDGGVVTNRYYNRIETAFTYLKPGTTNRIEMFSADYDREILEFDVEVPAGCQVLLTAREAGGFEFDRNPNIGLTIPETSSLTLSNVTFGVESGSAQRPYFEVNGGSLTLAAGVRISSHTGNMARDANGVTVCDGGEFTMLPGSEISDCYSSWNADKWTPDTDTQYYAVGGGLLVDNGTAYLHGGKITGCCATRGGGVYACNGSALYISGDMRITGNMWLDYGAPQPNGNLFVADQATVYLDGALTDKVGMGGAPWLTKDTNLVAEVSYVWTNAVEALASSASNFVHDVTGETGVAVTNGTDALIVWCGAVSDAGTYVKDNVTYRTLDAAPASDSAPTSTLLPEISLVAGVPDELAKLDDDTVAENVTTLEQYNDFRIWAENVEGGKEAVAKSDKAYVSYEFGTTNLFENAPAVEITQVVGVDGGLTLSVVVKDGEDAMAVASAKVAKMFEATSDLGDWTTADKRIDLTADDVLTDLTQATEKKVEFTIKPVGTPSKVFIRLKY